MCQKFGKEPRHRRHSPGQSIDECVSYYVMPVIHALVLAENSWLCLRGNGLKIRKGKFGEYQGISKAEYQGETSEVRCLTCMSAFLALGPLKLK